MVMLPPPQFDHVPAVPVIEYVLPVEEVNRLCRHGMNRIYPELWGCAVVKDGRCHVARIAREDVRRHELAHCNGWGRLHDGGVPSADEITMRRDR